MISQALQPSQPMTIPYMDNYFGLRNVLEDEIKYGINIEYDKNQKLHKQRNYIQKVHDRYDRMETLPESDNIKRNLLNRIRTFGDQSYRSLVNQIGNDAFNQTQTVVQQRNDQCSNDQNSIFEPKEEVKQNKQSKVPKTIFHEYLQKMIQREFGKDYKPTDERLFQKLKEILADQKPADFHYDVHGEQYLELLKQKLIQEQQQAQKLQEEQERLIEMQKQQQEQLSQNIQKSKDMNLKRFSDDIVQLQEMIHLTLLKNQQLKAQLDYLTFSQHNYGGENSIEGQFQKQKEIMSQLSGTVESHQQTIQQLKQQKDAVVKENLALLKKVKQKAKEKQEVESITPQNALNRAQNEVLLNEEDEVYSGVAVELPDTVGNQQLQKQLRLVDLHLAELRKAPEQKFNRLYSDLYAISDKKPNLMEELEILKTEGNHNNVYDVTSSIFSQDTKKSFEEQTLESIQSEIEEEKKFYLENKKMPHTAMHFSMSQQVAHKDVEKQEIKQKDVIKETEMIKSFIQEGKEHDEKLEKSRIDFMNKSQVHKSIVGNEIDDESEQSENEEEQFIRPNEYEKNGIQQIKITEINIPEDQQPTKVQVQQLQKDESDDDDEDSDDMKFNITVKNTYRQQIDEKQKKNQELLKLAQQNIRAGK